VMSVHTIDLDYLGTPGSIASYVLLGDDGPVMIETGPGNTTDTLTRGLADLGLTPADVKHVLLTHIHFDHAGASGWMASHGAQIYVHEFGAKHLIDPTRLLASAKMVYGDQMDPLWGPFLPIPAGQVTALHGGETLHLGGLEIRVIETPGHARHHHSFATTVNGERICFTGDAGATRIAECPSFVSVPMPPPDLDLEAWLNSVDTLTAEGFDKLYPTHFGVVDDPADHLGRVKTALIDHAEFLRGMIEIGLDEETMMARYLEWFLGEATAAGAPPEKIGFYIRDTIAGMNFTGLVRYWTKQLEKDGVTTGVS